MIDNSYHRDDHDVEYLRKQALLEAFERSAMCAVCRDVLPVVAIVLAALIFLGNLLVALAVWLGVSPWLLVAGALSVVAAFMAGLWLKGWFL